MVRMGVGGQRRCDQGGRNEYRIMQICFPLSIFSALFPTSFLSHSSQNSAKTTKEELAFARRYAFFACHSWQKSKAKRSLNTLYGFPERCFILYVWKAMLSLSLPIRIPWNTETLLHACPGAYCVYFWGRNHFLKNTLGKIASKTPMIFFRCRRIISSPRRREPRWRCCSSWQTCTWNTWSTSCGTGPFSYSSAQLQKPADIDVVK